MTNSPDLNPFDYHVSEAMLERYKTFQPKPNNIDELKKVLQTIWDDLPQNSINKAVLSFIKRLRACVKAGGGHFEHVLNGLFLARFLAFLSICTRLHFNGQNDVLIADRLVCEKLTIFPYAELVKSVLDWLFMI